MKMVFRSPIFFLFCILACTGNGQVTVDVQGKRIHIPFFRTDSAGGYENIFTKINVLPSLNESDAALEIRMYSQTGFMITEGHINIMKFYRDSIAFSKLVYTRFYDRNASITRLTAPQIEGIRSYMTDRIQRRQVWVSTPGSVIVDSLVRKGLFEVADQRYLLDSLKKAGIKVADPCEGWTDCFSGLTALVEIKAGPYKRSFHLLLHNFYRINGQLRCFQKQQAILSELQKFIF